MTSPDHRTIRTRTIRRPPSERRDRSRRAAMRKGAHLVGITLSDTVVFGDCVLGLDPDGRIYRWMGGRWVRLEPVTAGIRRAASAARGIREAAGALETVLGQAGGAP